MTSPVPRYIPRELHDDYPSPSDHFTSSGGKLTNFRCGSAGAKTEFAKELDFEKYLNLVNESISIGREAYFS